MRRREFISLFCSAGVGWALKARAQEPNNARRVELGEGPSFAGKNITITVGFEAGSTACWSTAASMGPQPVLEQMRALLAKDAETLRVIAKDLAWAREPIAEITGDAELFATYNIQMEKIRIQEAGYCKAGPIRPPYNVMPDRYAECAKENARRWRELCKKYSSAPMSVRN
jgi:hypothetical protein